MAATGILSPAAWARRDLDAPHAARLACVALGLVLVADLLDGRLGWMYSAGFIGVSLAVALGVRHRSLFAAGLLPAGLMLGSLAVVAVVAGDAIVVPGLADTTGAPGRWLAAVIDRGVTLIAGSAAAVAVILVRLRTDPEA
ncbi:hypothetical protein HMPREF0063_11963 [Aeromicrobium marinum DSM 15272]|uniref:DUF6542 domain-containing protein n=1 Tax=Aeromicrobium marinum DSM 15272 TaxID=585531 RepID=E2SE27_9ACTN|nr:DUF6542 domain-containing protein [Aeromicrobium marinum]EFQ82754.1 hypothetical protein HMPREF0063_11963 [Aeromicrobium marinum DSM 15272]